MSTTTNTATATARSSGDAFSSALSTALSSAVSSALSITGSRSVTASASSSTQTTSSTTRSIAPITSFNPNEASGSAQQQEGVSLETFLASLAVAAIVFGVEVLLFVLLRKKLHRVYEPRTTFLVPEKRRTPKPSAGFLNFFAPVFLDIS